MRAFLRRRPLLLIAPFRGASSKGPFVWLHLRIGWLSREGVKEKVLISQLPSPSGQLLEIFVTFRM